MSLRDELHYKKTEFHEAIRAKQAEIRELQRIHQAEIRELQLAKLAELRNLSKARHNERRHNHHRKDDLRTTDTKDLALKEARRLFAEGNYKNVSLDHIAKTLDVTRPALYHHFPGGREQLIVEMIQDYGSDLEQYYDEVLSSYTTTRERLRALLLMTTKQHLIDPGSLIGNYIQELSVESIQTVSGVFDKLVEKLFQILREGMERGELRRMEPEVIFFFYDGIFEKVERLLKPRHPMAKELAERFGNPEKLVDTMVELLLHGLEPSKTPS